MISESEHQRCHQFLCQAWLPKGAALRPPLPARPRLPRARRRRGGPVGVGSLEVSEAVMGWWVIYIYIYIGGIIIDDSNNNDR